MILTYIISDTSHISNAGVLASKNAGIECVNIYDPYADIDRDKIESIADYSIEFLSLIEEYLQSNSKKCKK